MKMESISMLPISMVRTTIFAGAVLVLLSADPRTDLIPRLVGQIILARLAMDLHGPSSGLSTLRSLPSDANQHNYISSCSCIENSRI